MYIFESLFYVIRISFYHYYVAGFEAHFPVCYNALLSPYYFGNKAVGRPQHVVYALSRKEAAQFDLNLHAYVFGLLLLSPFESAFKHLIVKRTVAEKFGYEERGKYRYRSGQKSRIVTRDLDYKHYRGERSAHARAEECRHRDAYDEFIAVGIHSPKHEQLAEYAADQRAYRKHGNKHTARRAAVETDNDHHHFHYE